MIAMVCLGGWAEESGATEKSQAAQTKPEAATGKPASRAKVGKFAANVDRNILSSLEGGELDAADDATFLRRVSFDIIGRPATPGEITRFGLDSSPDKRLAIVDSLLSNAAYAANWSRYWQEAIFRRATNVRAGIVRPAFGEWLEGELAASRGWDDIVTELVTSTGPVAQNGDTGLIFAHEGVPEEIAAEASRLFLGIQIQCANCHDHPWDKWKREEFHEFVAFFPRVSVRRDRNSDNMFDFEVTSVDFDRRQNPAASRFLLTRLDRNRDGILSENEAENSPLSRLISRNKELVDKNGDGKISIEEVLTAQPPDANRPGQGATEHFMPDLSDPGSEGRRIDPVFFVGGKSVEPGLRDADRRDKAAEFITSPKNPWFARAIVNRLWYEMTGVSFYTPIDDLGPDRTVVHEDALKLLCDGFVENGHDLKWLIRTIAATQVYQRAPDSDAEGFARCVPTRLRSDQLYASLCQTLGITALPMRPSEGRRSPYERANSDPGREEFGRIFGFDPSTPREELTGSIPESLFLMNSALIQRLVSDRSGNNLLTRLSTQVISDEDLISELYLASVGREPSDGERTTAVEHIQSAENAREGFEDLLWALLNSPEFISKR